MAEGFPAAGDAGSGWAVAGGGGAFHEAGCEGVGATQLDHEAGDCGGVV